MKLILACALLGLAILVAPVAAFGQDGEEPQGPGFQDSDVSKSGQTGFKFLSLSLDPRASALAGAVTALDGAGSIGMLYNPAGMARQERALDLAFTRTEFIADINYHSGSVSFRPAGGVYGVFGLALVAVDYGTFEETITGPDGYIDLGTFSPSALAVGLGYARALSDRFAIGGNVKYAYQNLGTFPVGRDESQDLLSEDYNKGTAAFDFGVLYNTGFRSLNLAMSVRNFSPELRYEQESFELPLTFRIGVAMDLVDLTSMDPNLHAINLSIDAERPRDFSEQIRVGGEYVFMNTLALRIGYAVPTETEQLNLGVGVQQRIAGFGFAFNYAYTSYDVFDAVHRLGVQLSL